tara:strand:- start:1905 stop:2486 length:582 start_codon:yes stop_codon:yes gene_type:complete
MKKKIVVLILIFIIIIVGIFYFTNSKKNKVLKIDKKETIEDSFTSNIIENVEYLSRDASGNEYIIRAKKGEIDLNNNDIIFLTDVSAIIKLNNSKEILIFANFGKYNINNFDTIFSKNVIINYFDKKINSEYLDFSIKRNSMIITKDVIYIDTENTLKTDVVEIDLKTKNANFYMYDKNKKINIINQKSNGNN